MVLCWLLVLHPKQEFMILPTGAKTFAEAMQIGAEVSHPSLVAAGFCVGRCHTMPAFAAMRAADVARQATYARHTFAVRKRAIQQS
jgi:Enolase, C-terminal TIM barrel domain